MARRCKILSLLVFIIIRPRSLWLEGVIPDHWHKVRFWDSSERYSLVSRDSSHSSVSLAVSLDSYLFMENPTTELQEYDAPYVVLSLSRGGMKSLRVNFLTTLEALGRDSFVAPSEAVEEVSAFSGTSCLV
ncbi:hypothetical protein AAC387_Pa03g1462 [Persea americana]